MKSTFLLLLKIYHLHLEFMTDIFATFGNHESKMNTSKHYLNNSLTHYQANEGILSCSLTRQYIQQCLGTL